MQMAKGMSAMPASNWQCFRLMTLALKLMIAHRTTAASVLGLEPRTQPGIGNREPGTQPGSDCDRWQLCFFEAPQRLNIWSRQCSEPRQLHPSVADHWSFAAEHTERKLMTDTSAIFFIHKSFLEVRESFLSALTKFSLKFPTCCLAALMIQLLILLAEGTVQLYIAFQLFTVKGF